MAITLPPPLILLVSATERPLTFWLFLSALPSGADHTTQQGRREDSSPTVPLLNRLNPINRAKPAVHLEVIGTVTH